MSRVLAFVLAIALILFPDPANAQGQFLQSKQSGVGFGYLRYNWAGITTHGVWMASTSGGNTDIGIQLTGGDNKVLMLGGSVFAREKNKKEYDTFLGSFDLGLGAANDVIFAGLGTSMYLNMPVTRSAMAQLSFGVMKGITLIRLPGGPKNGSPEATGQIALSFYARTGRIKPNLTISYVHSLPADISVAAISFGFIIGANTHGISIEDDW